MDKDQKVTLTLAARQMGNLASEYEGQAREDFEFYASILTAMRDAQDDTDKALAMLVNPAVGTRVALEDGGVWELRKFSGRWYWCLGGSAETFVALNDILPLLRAAVEGGAKVVMP